MIGFPYREAYSLPYGQLLDYIAMYEVMANGAVCKADSEDEFWGMMQRR